MNTYNNRRAFSLVELLVALSILAVVAAIIVPRFLNVREEAVRVTATAQLTEVNNIYKKWAVLGGRPGAATAAQILTFLCTPGTNTDSTRGLAGNPCRDSTSAFGSYTVGLSATAPVAATPTSASPDGFYVPAAAIPVNGGTIGAAIAANTLVYKQGNFVFPIGTNGLTGDALMLTYTLVANQPAYALL